MWAAYRLARRKVVPTVGPGGLFSPLHVASPARPLEPLPLPNWIAEYFDVCADGLLSGDDPTDALLMTIAGGHRHHTQFLNLERDENIAAFVDTLLSLTPADAAQAIKDMKLEGDAVDLFLRVLKQGATTADRICLFVAHHTEQPGNPFSSKRLSYEMVRSTYYRLKDSV